MILIGLSWNWKVGDSSSPFIRRCCALPELRIVPWSAPNVAAYSFSTKLVFPLKDKKSTAATRQKSGRNTRGGFHYCPVISPTASAGYDPLFHSFWIVSL